jgi:hypothetical protein
MIVRSDRRGASGAIGCQRALGTALRAPWSRRGLAFLGRGGRSALSASSASAPTGLTPKDREGLCRNVSAASFTIFAEAMRYSRASSRNRSASRFAFSRRVFQPLLAAALRFFRPRSSSLHQLLGGPLGATPGVLHLA